MWQLPVATLTIEPEETHLWYGQCVPDALNLKCYEEMLTPEEIARAGRLATETLRRRYVQAHSLLHTLLGAYTQAGTLPCDLAYHAQGKPYLRAPQLQPALEFNMSHTDEVVMIALTRGQAVGVDIEMFRPLEDLSGMIALCCTSREAAYLATLAMDARLFAFYRLWTRKEAWLKLLGVGLGSDLTSVEVHDTPVGVTLLDIPLPVMTGGTYMAALALPVHKHPPPVIVRDVWWQDMR